MPNPLFLRFADEHGNRMLVFNPETVAPAAQFLIIEVEPGADISFEALEPLLLEMGCQQGLRRLMQNQRKA